MREYRQETTPEELSLEAVQFWRRQVGRQLYYWERVCRRMAQTNFCRVNPVYRGSHTLRQDLREMARHLEELEGRVRDRLKPPTPPRRLPAAEGEDDWGRVLEEETEAANRPQVRYTDAG